MREVRPFEPWFFILFGLFHLHRVWGLLDRESYAAFWLGVLTERGVFYWTRWRRWVGCASCTGTVLPVLPGAVLVALVYLFGGGYVLFDLFAIAADLPFGIVC